MEYEIEKGIPTPGIGRKWNFPLNKLEQGESFVIPMEAKLAAQGACSHYSKKNGAKFLVRKISEEKCRVWRIS